MTPTKSGLYWARTHGYNWFNLIAEVSGDAPFLSIATYDLHRKTHMHDALPSAIVEWGPDISKPEPKTRE